MCYTSARGLEMKAPFINNLSTQTGDVLLNPQNPVNPDLNNWLLHAEFPSEILEVLVFGDVSYK